LVVGIVTDVASVTSGTGTFAGPVAAAAADRADRAVAVVADIAVARTLQIAVAPVVVA